MVYLLPPSPLHTHIVHELLGCDPGPCLVKLSQAVDFDVPAAPEGLRRFTVPAGFVYDRATMPLVVRWVVDRDKLDPAALAHDWALDVPVTRGDVSRADADRLFLAVALATPNLSRFKARLAYWGVRLASAFS